MKVKKKNDVTTRIGFSAPVFNASPRAGEPKKLIKDSYIDLNSILAPKPQNVYMVHVQGDSMIDECIYSGDILIVDKTLSPGDGTVVIAALNGELLVKTYRVIEGKVYLFSANQRFLPIEIFPDWQFEVQGVVKHVIHSL